MSYHLVILKKPYLEAIISGQKRIESRFGRIRRVYFGRVSPGDQLFLKLSAGPVCATAVVAMVKSFEDLTPAQVAKLKHRYNHQIGASDAYWRSKAGCKYGMLVWLKGVEPIEPVRIAK